MHAPLPSTSESLPPEAFIRRHLGPDEREQTAMLTALGVPSLDELTDRIVPSDIRTAPLMPTLQPISEEAALRRLRELADRNNIFRSFIGQGYYPCHTSPVILRNVLENPGWYTAYTPYQAEASQGRLEALLNFQTMVSDLTGMEIANASLLDEATAAAEAMAMCLALAEESPQSPTFWVADHCHPQTRAVVRTRAEALGVRIVTGSLKDASLPSGLIGALVQTPDTFGTLHDLTELAQRVHAAGAKLVVATDLLALCLTQPPGAAGADIVVGSTQRLGMPMGFGGPHAAFFATRDAFKRAMPGRLIGVSRDAHGRPAMRLSLQTREQHIRRDKATSNICTAQVLPAVVAAMTAVYHGPERLRAIAARIHGMTIGLREALRASGLTTSAEPCFDTFTVQTPDPETVAARAQAHRINLRRLNHHTWGVALDEVTTDAELAQLREIFTGQHAPVPWSPLEMDSPLRRTLPYLTHPVFHRYHTETAMLRYLKRLENKDISLTHSMIPLGSCTMKLNATAEMIPITWPGFAHIHPCAPAEQTAGYRQLIADLESWLAEITGLPAVSLQPNAGSQGEYAGLLAIRNYQKSIGQTHRNICLIPQSAHGTNFASAVMAGLRVVVVKCDPQGNVDLNDLAARIGEHQNHLSCVMVTYPSTHGVFESGIRSLCDQVHAAGGQVYMDGANMNAQVGLCSPGSIGADVCHLNLHKTFCIPHGGGGPGMGPIAAAEHLRPFLPSSPFADQAGATGPVSAAPYGSGSILPISWAYIAMMGGSGLTRATQIAILNANYIAHRLKNHFPILFSGPGGFVAHECIIDLRPFKTAAGIEVEDVAKRLLDYGFHAPTMSWPVPGTLMIEPTESESKEELDRFCDAMLAIHTEIQDIIAGNLDRADNPLKNAPHTATAVAADTWNHPYSRRRAAYPLPWVEEQKYWPPVGRVDNVYGDRNLFCSCVVPAEATSS